MFLKTETDLINEASATLKELLKNPIIKLYLDDWVKDHVDFERLLGNTNALIGQWKHNTIRDITTSVQSPIVVKIAFCSMIDTFGPQITFKAVLETYTARIRG